MFKIGKYYLITDYNWKTLQKIIRKNYKGAVRPLVYIGDVYVCQDEPQWGNANFTARIQVGANKYLYLVNGALKELVTQFHDVEVTSLIGLSLFNREAKKFEAELQQKIQRYRNEAKTIGSLEKQPNKPISTANSKLSELTEYFSEPLFFDLNIMADNVTFTKQVLQLVLDEGDHHQYTAIYDVLDECHKREKELDDLIWLFREKQTEMKLQLLDNKADQALEKV